MNERIELPSADPLYTEAREDMRTDEERALMVEADDAPPGSLQARLLDALATAIEGRDDMTQCALVSQAAFQRERDDAAALLLRCVEAEKERDQLRAYRDRNITLGLEVGQILGSAYDGADFRQVARDLVAAKARCVEAEQQLVESDKLWDAYIAELQNADGSNIARPDIPNRIQALRQQLTEALAQLKEIAQAAELPFEVVTIAPCNHLAHHVKATHDALLITQTALEATRQQLAESLAQRDALREKIGNWSYRVYCQAAMCEVPMRKRELRELTDELAAEAALLVDRPATRQET